MQDIRLITGACGRIGSTLARHWDTKAHLLLLDADPLALQRLDEELGGDHTLIPFDLWLSPPQHYQRLADMIREDYGRLDSLIHLAAYCGNLRPLFNTEAEDWLKALQVNLTAPLWLSQYLLPLLQQSAAPKLAFSVFNTLEEQAHYWHGFGIAQAALNRMIRDISEENGSYPNLAVCRIDTGWVESSLSRNIFPDGRPHWRQAEDIVPLFDRILDAPAGQLTEISHEQC